jgi:hypothetical protein
MDPSDHLFRREAGRMVATLTRIFGVHNLALAGDIVQDAFWSMNRLQAQRPPFEVEKCLSPESIPGFGKSTKIVDRKCITLSADPDRTFPRFRNYGNVIEKPSGRG